MVKEPYLPFSQWEGVKNKWVHRGVDPYFKEVFLDLWYAQDKTSWEEANKACDNDGTDMLVWLKDHNPELHEKLWEESKEQMAKELEEDKDLPNAEVTAPTTGS